MPLRPRGPARLPRRRRQFQGRVGQVHVALHFAHPAALDGYRVLVVGFVPQATLSHSMGLTDVGEDHTVWVIMARDLERDTGRMNAAAGAETATALPRRKLPSSIRDMGRGSLRPADFVKPAAWPTIDIVPNCANAVFVEFAGAQYRRLNPKWTFLRHGVAVSRCAAGRCIRPDPVRLPARHRLSVDERGFLRRTCCISLGPRLLRIRIDHQLHRPAGRGA